MSRFNGKRHGGRKNWTARAVPVADVRVRAEADSDPPDSLGEGFGWPGLAPAPFFRGPLLAYQAAPGFCLIPALFIGGQAQNCWKPRGFR